MIDAILLKQGLEELAIKELQRQLWVNGGDDYMSSFEEAVCTVFDDARVTVGLDSGYLSRNYSADFCLKVSQLSAAIDKIPTNMDPSILIEHPAMEKVRSFAADALKMFENETRK